MSPVCQRIASLVFSSLLVLILGATVASAQSFTDTQFLDADWTASVEVLNLGGSVNGSQVAAGGDPGAFRRVNNVLSAATGQPFSNSVFGFHRRAGATWNPSVQGAIASIDYSESSYRYAGSGVQALGIALRQGGVTYYGPGGLTPSTVGIWQANAWTGLTATSFDALAPGVQNPDLGASGGPIEFGFYRSNSTSVGGGGGTVSGGIDNWSVTLNVPTPAAAITWGRLKADRR